MATRTQMTSWWNPATWTLGRLAREVLPPVLVFWGVVGLWALAVRIWQPAVWILPGPGLVWERLVTQFPRLWAATLHTGQSAVAGFGLSLVVGTGLAFVMAQARVIERSLYPYAIFLQTVPIIAIAPIIVLWFDYGQRAIIVVAFIISLFPIITNTVVGLTTPRLEWLELMRVYRGNWWQILWKVRTPAAVPHMVTGARVSAGLSVVGAIVGEYFTALAGKTEGLAAIIAKADTNMDTAFLMATTLMSAQLGLFIFIIVGVTGDAVLRIGHFQEERK